jgi:hypothetical protein
VWKAECVEGERKIFYITKKEKQSKPVTHLKNQQTTHQTLHNNQSLLRGSLWEMMCGALLGTGVVRYSDESK